jgi:hypothetical protein
LNSIQLLPRSLGQLLKARSIVLRRPTKGALVPLIINGTYNCRLPWKAPRTKRKSSAVLAVRKKKKAGERSSKAKETSTLRRVAPAAVPTTLLVPVVGFTTLHVVVVTVDVTDPSSSVPI